MCHHDAYYASFKINTLRRNKHWRIQKGQSRMNNPEKLANWVHKTKEKSQHNRISFLCKNCNGHHSIGTQNVKTHKKTTQKRKKMNNVACPLSKAERLSWYIIVYNLSKVETVSWHVWKLITRSIKSRNCEVACVSAYHIVY